MAIQLLILHFLCWFDISTSSLSDSSSFPSNFTLRGPSIRHIRVIQNNANFNYYSPCHYPRPSDPIQFSQSCASVYLGSNIFCDPDHQFSRTEADSIRSVLTALNLSSCLCGSLSTTLTGQFENCRKFQSAILFIPSASLISGQGRTDRNDVTCDRVTKQGRPVHEMTKLEQLEKFTFQLVQIWREDSKCDLDLMHIVINKWYPDIERVEQGEQQEHKEQGQRKEQKEQRELVKVITYVSDRLQKRLSGHWPTFSVHSVGNRQSDIFIILKSLALALVNGTWPIHSGSALTDHSASTSIGDSYQTMGVSISMPDWAIILFIVCILMLPLCVLIGNVVSVVPSRRLAHAIPDPTSMRWANKRWRAGFGGGFFGIRWKSPITTAGDPAMAAMQIRPKPQSNNMMFRQFSKFKKPKQSTVQTNVEPRTMNWVYV